MENHFFLARGKGERIFLHFCGFSAYFTFCLVLLLFGFFLFFAFPLLKSGGYFLLLVTPWQPLAGNYGIAPMIAGTGVISLLAVCIAFPVSLGAAAFCEADLAHKNLVRWIRPVFQLMTGIPTVVYGFLAVFLLVPFLRKAMGGSGFSILAASLMLALLIAPTMILFFSDAFRAVPKEDLRAMTAMGARPEEKFVFLLLPRARSGIVAGVLLAAGRAVGDTLIALMLAGNSLAFPSSLTEPARTLTGHIALVMASDTQSPEFRSIFACGLTLYLITTLLIFFCRRLMVSERGNA
ncbi:PstC family ABC transporter permease [Desulfobotulus mexicanus]|uniref:ABC transporter permease subunit n=1 Tax=Desulfobotulus mexicanus TaxID=2586642 RepID=A0A5S5MC52_9BACT|nr:ABC transporter permease subunit [Desulfobotulus mexicanus]TYT73308.1 ABC transporter permease subunit [Desulfobotulus mexicanus]